VLGRGGDTSFLDLETIENLKVLSGLAVAEMKLEAAKTSIEKCSMKAMVSGVFKSSGYEVGDFIPGDELFGQITDTGSFLVGVSLPEFSLKHARQSVNVRINPIVYPGDWIKARVMDEEFSFGKDGLVGIKIRITKSPIELREGMRAWVFIRYPDGYGYIIPKMAIPYRQGQAMCALIRNNMVVWIPVDIISEHSSDFLVIGPFKENDSILVEGHLFLANSATIIANPYDPK
jgi:hypothetical protein